MRQSINSRSGSRVAVVILLAFTACSSASEPADTAASSPTVPSEPGAAPAARDVRALGVLSVVDPGTYFTDPDEDHSTPLKVVFEVAAAGWASWIGAAKFAGDGHVGVSITTVTNLVRDGCGDHSWSDPPVGHSVDDLAEALAALEPFKLTSAPEDVFIDGHRGKHLELTVPDLPVMGEGRARTFTGCVDGDLKSWVAAIDTEPGDAFYGYTGPGYVEEIWILDVEGTRLMIAAGRSRGSPTEDIDEMRTLLDSIRIEP